MTTRTYLPNDVARCGGGELPHCAHCARKLIPAKGTRTVWFSAPPLEDGKKDCAWFIDMEMDDN